MKRKQWEASEREILKTYYKVVSMKELLEMLPGRNENAIYKQVSYLRKRGWKFASIV